MARPTFPVLTDDDGTGLTGTIINNAKVDEIKDYISKGLELKNLTELTIATGVITITEAFHTVDTEANAETDDLVTINGGTTGALLVLRPANDARTIVVKHGTGNIWLKNKVDLSLDDLQDALALIYDGTKWMDLGLYGLQNVIEDTTPELGGDLDAANHSINNLLAIKAKRMEDADGDTKIQVEEAPDEDKIRMDVGGVESLFISNLGIVTYAKQSAASCGLTVDQWLQTEVSAYIFLDTEAYDVQNEFDSSQIAGTADATQANKLHDADGGFSAADVGKIVYNTTDKTYTTVSAFVDSGELTLTDDVMADGEGYVLFFAKFTATEPGRYLVIAKVFFSTDVIADKLLYAYIRKNGVTVMAHNLQTAIVGALGPLAVTVVDLAANDYVQIGAYHNMGVTRKVRGLADSTFLTIFKIS